MTSPIIIVHNANEAQTALEVAAAAGHVIDLACPPALSAATGPGVFAQQVALAKETNGAAFGEAWFHCGDDAGLAMAAIRHGGVGIVIDLPDETAPKIKEMASAAGVPVMAAGEFNKRQSSTTGQANN